MNAKVSTASDGKGNDLFTESFSLKVFHWKFFIESSSLKVLYWKFLTQLESSSEFNVCFLPCSCRRSPCDEPHDSFDMVLFLGSNGFDGIFNEKKITSWYPLAISMRLLCDFSMRFFYDGEWALLLWSNLASQMTHPAFFSLPLSVHRQKKSLTGRPSVWDSRRKSLDASHSPPSRHTKWIFIIIKCAFFC